MGWRVILLAGCLSAGLGTSYAQTTTEPQGPNSQPPPDTNVSGSGDLSDKLNRTNGVIRPKGNVDPKINKPAPVPNPNSTPVIPPPGTPGGPSGTQPK